MKPFERIFGNTAELRIIEFLLPLDGIEFSPKDISEEVHISEKRAKSILDKFHKHEIVTGNGIKYQINLKSDIVGAVIDINNAIIGILIKEGD